MSTQGPDGRHYLPVFAAGARQGLSLPRQYTALVDTGATFCMISPKAIRELKLPVIDTVDFASASEESTTTTLHIVKLTFSLTTGEPQTGETTVGSMASNPNYDVILGMNVLSNYRLEIHNGILTLESPS